ncbi:N-methyl-L-tryptophan oxidase [Aporhodopirellula aestuarii]|uniref:N-methyl-L-tryptophan oxidase n=1 Tax=Aporhodopirellula aestuarii TaxID=2950107 RepID=A0ABT0U4S1_9BACT|nr:N-methyl-L-tryptophan oxidase [Aporhodopirellula aestuarii]MCM2371898.1 N-methyl-L-tryptophan oxidase [Aporhodopirellula aestuarii]
MNTDSNWDLIVLGLGGVGSAAAYHAALAGLRVLGIDQYSPVHNHGSSHGKTRVIRQAYFEHPAYIPLLRRAYELWESLEQASDQRLFVRTGLVEVGPVDGVVVPGVIRSAERYGLDIEKLLIDQVQNRWPGLSASSEMAAVFESNAGYLKVESCVAAYLQCAADQGAVCRHNETVRTWSATTEGVVVETDQGRYSAARLIIAAGPWSGHVLSGLGVQLQVLRKHQYWFSAAPAESDQSPHLPCFFFELPRGYFYGFPSIDDNGIKVARHSGGQSVEIPTRGDYATDAEDLRLVQEFVREHLPGATTHLRSHAGCYYTMTSDEHFLIDTLPEHLNVVVIAGLSGHGFKFTSVLGEIAMHLAVGDTHDFNLDLFRINRFS